MGTVLLFTPSGFAQVFLFHLLILTPKGLVEEQPTDTNRTDLSNATASPLPFRLTETDSEKKQVDAKKTNHPSDSLLQPIVSAVSTVDVTMKTNKKIKFHSFILPKGAVNAAIATRLSSCLSLAAATALLC